MTTLDSTLVQAIGQITINFTMLSHAVEYVIWHLLGDNLQSGQIAPIVTSELSFPQSVDMFAALCKHRYPTRINPKELKRICGRLTHAADKRNRVAHSLWFVAGPGQSLRLKRSAKRAGMKVEIEYLTHADLATMNDEIEHITNEFWEFVVATVSKPFEKGAGQMARP